MDDLLARALHAIRTGSPQAPLIRALLEGGYDLYVDARGQIVDCPPLAPPGLTSPNGRFRASLENTGELLVVDQHAPPRTRSTVWSSRQQVDT